MQSFDFENFIKRSIPEDSGQLILFNRVLKLVPSLPKHGWLAGGAIRRLISGQKLDSDFDFFFKTQKDLNSFKLDLLGNENIRINQINESEHNTSYKIEISLMPSIYVKTTFQLISINYYNSLEDVLGSFDYTLCQFGIDKGKLICGDTSLWDLGRKRLAVNRITYPVASLRRLLKYTNQGYYACQGTLFALLNSVKEKPEMLENKIAYID